MLITLQNGGQKTRHSNQTECGSSTDKDVEGEECKYQDRKIEKSFHYCQEEGGWRHSRVLRQFSSFYAKSQGSSKGWMVGSIFKKVKVGQ